VKNAKMISAIVRETGGNLKVERATKRFTWTAGDERLLRGIPAIGRGVSGAVPGTRPDGICDRDDVREGRRAA